MRLFGSNIVGGTFLFDPIHSGSLGSISSLSMRIWHGRNDDQRSVSESLITERESVPQKDQLMKCVEIAGRMMRTTPMPPFV